MPTVPSIPPGGLWSGLRRNDALSAVMQYRCLNARNWVGGALARETPNENFETERLFQ